MAKNGDGSKVSQTDWKGDFGSFDLDWPVQVATRKPPRTTRTNTDRAYVLSPCRSVFVRGLSRRVIHAVQFLDASVHHIAFDKFIPEQRKHSATQEERARVAVPVNT